MAVHTPTSPFTWKTPAAQNRAHGLAIRATFAKPAPPKPVPCADCHLIHRGTC